MDKKLREPIRHTEYRHQIKERAQILEDLKKEKGQEKVFMNDFVKLKRINDSFAYDLD